MDKHRQNRQLATNRELEAADSPAGAAQRKRQLAVRQPSVQPEPAETQPEA
jgi:hypothetical protein